MRAVGLTGVDHPPQRSLGFCSRREDLRVSPHLPMPLEPDAVPLTSLEPANAAYRAAPDLVSQLEDLPHGQDRSLFGVLVAGPADPARVAGDDPVVLGRRVLPLSLTVQGLAEALRQVLGQVPDALIGVRRPGEHALDVHLIAEADHVHGLVVELVECFVSGA
nr:hypothetical protein [Nonomuraea sp. SYSU D8015]